MIDYMVTVGTYIALHATAACAAAFVFFRARLLIATFAAFYGVGAYTAATLATADIGLVWQFAVAAVIAAVMGVVLTVAGSTTNADRFFVLTLAAQLLFESVVRNTNSLGGATGMAGIPPLAGDFHQSSVTGFVAAALLLLTVLALVSLLDRRWFGLLLTAAGDDEVLFDSHGDRGHLHKARSVAIAAACAAAAGVLHARTVTFIDPTSFGIPQSILIIAIVLLGGRRSWGLVGAALVVFGVPEALRFIGSSAADAANWRQIAYAAAVVMAVFIRPRDGEQ